jgi:hypothetical protein
VTEFEENVRKLEEALAVASQDGDSQRVASLLGRLGSKLGKASPRPVVILAGASAALAR